MKYLSLLLVASMATLAQAQGPTLPERAIVPPSPAPQLPSPETAPAPVPPQESQAPIEKSVPAPTPEANIPPIPTSAAPNTASHEQPVSEPEIPEVPDAKQAASQVSQPASNQPSVVAPKQAPAPVVTHTYQQPTPVYYNGHVWGVPHYPGVNPAGAEGVFVGPSTAGRLHARYPYYDYRRPWYPRGPRSLNVDIVW